MLPELALPLLSDVKAAEATRRSTGLGDVASLVLTVIWPLSEGMVMTDKGRDGSGFRVVSRVAELADEPALARD